MGMMARFAKLDSAMQRGLDNSLALVFGGRVVPPEIEELLKQEIEDNMVHTYEGYVEAPNVFEILVSPKDFENLSAEHPDLPQDFADQMTRHIRNQGWQTAGPVSVAIKESDLKTGQLKATSTVAPDAGISAYSGQQQSAQDPLQQSEEPVHKHINLLLQDGSSRTYAVHEGSNIIGRGAQADFRLPDTGVSREHAEITWDGNDAVLVDLESTNGTTVNDIPVENWMLADGDVINLGHSTIEVRITQ